MRLRMTVLLVMLVVVCLPENAMAHPDHAEHMHGIWDGAAHPLLGWDHLLAIVTVGLLSAQQRGRALWAVPLQFVLSMIVGGIAGMCNAYLPAVELGIAASVVLLGVAVARGRLGSLGMTMLVIGAFGLIHGHTHGREVPAFATSALYATGFVVWTILLHLLGVAVGWCAMRSATGKRSLRLGGAAIACAGIVLVSQRSEFAVIGAV